MRQLTFVFLGLCALIGAQAAAAVPTVDPVPFKEMKLPNKGAVSYSGGELKMFTITWGGDVATVHSNGDAKCSKPGSFINEAGLNVCLENADDFVNQVKTYIRGQTPFLRGTTDMITAVSEFLCEDSGLCPVVFYNISRSAGGDSLVARKGINTLEDLRGNDVCLQAYGPHMYLLGESLASVGMSVSDVNVKWYKDLGFEGEASAAHAFAAGECDAAFVIYPDMLEVIGGESNVDGAKEIFSTAGMDRVIYDVIAARADFAKAHPDVLAGLTNALLRGNESLARIVRDGGDPSMDTHANRSRAYRAAAVAAAEVLLGTKGVIKDENTVMEMFKFDLRMQGWTGNVNFVTDPGSKRGVVWFGSVKSGSANTLASLGLVRNASAVKLSTYQHSWDGLKAGLSEKFGVEAPRLNRVAVRNVVESLSVEEAKDRTITELVIYFESGQNEFSAAQYASDFDRVLRAMEPSSGPVVVVTGHSETYKYLGAKYGKRPQPEAVWKEIVQSARNLSHSRSVKVVEALQQYAKDNGYDVSFAGVVPVGRHVSEPAAGMCRHTTQSGARVQDPCLPDGYNSPNRDTKQKAWAEQQALERRVVFRVVNVASETEVYTDAF